MEDGIFANFLPVWKEDFFFSPAARREIEITREILTAIVSQDNIDRGPVGDTRGLD